jgi:hypothetical protein
LFGTTPTIYRGFRRKQKKENMIVAKDRNDSAGRINEKA